MLTLGWSDGHTFLPLDFALLSSVKAGPTGIHPGIDKRSCGYKRRKESLLAAPHLVSELVELMNEIVNKVGKKLSAMIKSQRQHWISALPSYIKAYLPISSCES